MTSGAKTNTDTSSKDIAAATKGKTPREQDRQASKLKLL